MKSILPPRKKDAVPGKVQIGLFMRTGDGVVEVTKHESTPAMVRTATDLLFYMMDPTFMLVCNFVDAIRVAVTCAAIAQRAREAATAAQARHVYLASDNCNHNRRVDPDTGECLDCGEFLP